MISDLKKTKIDCNCESLLFTRFIMHFPTLDFVIDVNWINIKLTQAKSWLLIAKFNKFHNWWTLHWTDLSWIITLLYSAALQTNLNSLIWWFASVFSHLYTVLCFESILYKALYPHSWADWFKLIEEQLDWNNHSLCSKEFVKPQHTQPWGGWTTTEEPNGYHSSPLQIRKRGTLFLAHFRPLSAIWASFKCHGLPEHCFWPCPSLHGYHVPILWWLLPAE